MKLTFEEFWEKLKQRHVEQTRLAMYREAGVAPSDDPKWVRTDMPLKELRDFGLEPEDEENE